MSDTGSGEALRPRVFNSVVVVRHAFMKALKDAHNTAPGIARMFKLQRLYGLVMDRERARIPLSNWAVKGERV